MPAFFKCLSVSLVAVAVFSAVKAEFASNCCEFNEVVADHYQDGHDDISDAIGNGKLIVTSIQHCRDLCCERGCLSLDYNSATKECRLSSNKVHTASGGALKVYKGISYQERKKCTFAAPVNGKIWSGHNDITDRTDIFPNGHPNVTSIEGCKQLCCQWSCASLEFTASNNECRLSSQSVPHQSSLKDSPGEIYMEVQLSAVGVNPSKCGKKVVSNDRCNFRDAVPGYYQAARNDISDKFKTHPRVESIEACKDLCCEHGCISFDYNSNLKQCRLSSFRACVGTSCPAGGGPLVAKAGETYQEKLPCYFQAPKLNSYQPARNDISDAFITGHPKVTSLAACKALCCKWSCVSFEFTQSKSECRLSSYRAFGKGGGALAKATDGTMYVELVVNQPHTKCTFADPKVGKYQTGSNAITDHFDTHPLVKDLNDCKRLCCEFGCISLDYNTASRECRLSNTRAGSAGGGFLASQANETYVERTSCNFESPQKGKYLPAHNDITDMMENSHPKVANIEECRLLCCEHGCRSLEYKISTSECRLSSETAKSLGYALMSDPDDIYQEAKSGLTTCNFNDAIKNKNRIEDSSTKISKNSDGSYPIVSSAAACRNLCCAKGCLGLLYTESTRECRLFSTRVTDYTHLTDATGKTYQERETCKFHGAHQDKIWSGNNDITDVKANFPNGHPKVTSILECQSLCCAWNCASLEYTSHTGECRLSSMAVVSVSTLKSAPGETYQMRDVTSHPCQASSSSKSKSTSKCGSNNLEKNRCKYEKAVTGFAQKMTPIATLDAVTVEICKQLCCQYQCLSFNYDRSKTSKQCALSTTRACRPEDGASCKTNVLVKTENSLYQEKLPCHFGKEHPKMYMPGRNDISDVFLGGHPVVDNMQGCKDLCCLWSCASLEYNPTSKQCRLSSARASQPNNGGAALVRAQDDPIYVETTLSQPHRKCRFEKEMKGYYLQGRNDISDTFDQGHPQKMTLQQCKDLCCEHGCMSLDYNTNRGECRLSSSRAAGIAGGLKKQSDETYMERKNCNFGFEQKGVYLAGHNDLTDGFQNKHPVTRDVEECRTLCCEEETCKSLEFTSSTNECRLSTDSATSLGVTLKKNPYDTYQERLKTGIRVTTTRSGAGDNQQGGGNVPNAGGLDGGGIAAIIIIVLLLVGGIVTFFVIRSKQKQKGGKYATTEHDGNRNKKGFSKFDEDLSFESSDGDDAGKGGNGSFSSDAEEDNTIGEQEEVYTL